MSDYAPLIHKGEIFKDIFVTFDGVIERSKGRGKGLIKIVSNKNKELYTNFTHNRTVQKLRVAECVFESFEAGYYNRHYNKDFDYEECSIYHIDKIVTNNKVPNVDILEKKKIELINDCPAKKNYDKLKPAVKQKWSFIAREQFKSELREYPLIWCCRKYGLSGYKTLETLCKNLGLPKGANAIKSMEIQKWNDL